MHVVAKTQTIRDRVAHGAPGLTLSLSSLLRLKPGADLELAVRNGLPFSAFSAVEECLGVTTAQLSKHIRIPSRTLNRRMHDNALNPEESDRLTRLGSILAKAITLFDGDEAAARKWMLAPSRALAGMTPLQRSDTHLGAQEVATLIDQIEEGVFV